MILAAASIVDPNYVPTNYQTFLLTVFIMVSKKDMAQCPRRVSLTVRLEGDTRLHGFSTHQMDRAYQ